MTTRGMMARFAISCADGMGKTYNREGRMAFIQRELSLLTGRDVIIFDDVDFGRVQFTFTDKGEGGTP